MGVHFQRAQALFDLRRYFDAVNELSLELEDNPQSAEAFSMRAAALLNLGYAGSAEEQVQIAIGLDPECAYSFYVLSAVRARLGQLAAAEEAVLEALRISLDPTWFYQLGTILYERKRYDECLAATQRALALNPWDEGSLLLRVRALSALGHKKDAEQLLAKALAYNPESPAAHHAAGQLALQTGRPWESLSSLREARRLDPISYNDTDSIAFAYGRRLPLFRLVDPLILRWYTWPPKLRWVLYTIIGTYAFALSMWFIHAYGDAFGIAFLGYMTLINLCIFSIAYRELVSTAAKLSAGRELDQSFSDKLGAMFVCVVRLIWLHVYLSGMLAFVAILPPLTFFVYGGVANSKFFSDFLHISSVRRGVAYSLVAAGLVVLIVLGAGSSVTRPVLGSAMWLTLVCVSYFSTDLSHCLMRPRAINLQLRRGAS